jgi:hypothetical protein
MANVLYDKGRQGFLEGSIDWDTDDIRGLIVDSTDYTQNLATHDNLDDIPAPGRVAVTTAFTAKTVTDGIANATIPLLTAVAGDSCEYFIVYKHTGTDSTSRLIASYDISYTPTCNDLQISFNTGANKAFKL